MTSGVEPRRGISAQILQRRRAGACGKHALGRSAGRQARGKLSSSSAPGEGTTKRRMGDKKARQDEARERLERRKRRKNSNMAKSG